jgi:glycogen synthase
MRVLIISNRYPPHIMGGYEICCQLVAEGLRRRGHNVHILTTMFKVNRKVKEDNVYRWLHLNWESSDPFQLAWWESLDKRRTEGLIKQLRPEVIFIWCGQGLFPSVLRVLMKQEIPLVYQVQDIWLTKAILSSNEWAGFWSQRGRGWLKGIAKPFLRKIFSGFETEKFVPLSVTDVKFENAIFCSYFQKSLNQDQGFNAQDDVIIYNCVDTKKFYQHGHQRNDQPVRFLFTGRLCEDKGAHIALRAVDQVIKSGVKNVTLSIVGIPQPPFDYFEELKNFAHQSGLDQVVVFMDSVDNHQMPDVYNSHDVLILPSFHKEGFSMVVLEAMACGLTVIGTTSGGSAEIFKSEENSLVFEPGDLAKLAEHMTRLVKEPALRMKLAEAGNQLIHENFTLENMVQETENYILKVLNR